MRALLKREMIVVDTAICRSEHQKQSNTIRISRKVDQVFSGVQAVTVQQKVLRRNSGNGLWPRV
jgi:hypothetical protein